MNDKPIRIFFEYSDRVEYLEGKQAAKWWQAVNGMCILGHFHGNDFPEFKWKTKKK